MATSNFVDTPGLRIHYLQEGTLTPGKDPVIFLHGFPQTSHQWRHQIKALSDAGYACFAPDNRGFGQTDKPLMRISRGLLARDVARFMDAVGIEKAHFVVHDWGSIIGFKFVADFADRITSYAMVDSLCTVWAPMGMHGYWFKAEGLAEEFFKDHHETFIECLFGGRSGADLPSRPLSPWGFGEGTGGGLPYWIDAEDLDHYKKSFADPASHHACIQYYRYGLPFHLMEETGPRVLSESEVGAMWLHEGGIEEHPLFKQYLDYGPEDNATVFEKPAISMYGSYRFGKSVEQGDETIRRGNAFDDQFPNYFPNLKARAVNGFHFLGEEAKDYVSDQLLQFLGEQE
jgi:pimeloyl-ACP methyl ester carboxylesterase